MTSTDDDLAWREETRARVCYVIISWWMLVTARASMEWRTCRDEIKESLVRILHEDQFHLGVVSILSIFLLSPTVRKESGFISQIPSSQVAYCTKHIKRVLGCSSYWEKMTLLNLMFLVLSFVRGHSISFKIRDALQPLVCSLEGQPS